MLRTSVFIALIACAGAAQEPPPSPWQYIHQDAVIIGGVEWQKLSQSPFLRELKRELGAALKVTQKGDPLVMDQLEAIYFSAADMPDGTDMKHTRGVALVRMRSSIDPLLRAVMKGRARRQNYNGTYVLIPEGEKSGEWRIAVLDGNHALMGDWPSLRAALNRTSPPPETPLVTRAKQIAASADVWVVTNDPGVSKATNPMLADVLGIDAALSFGSHAELTLQLTTPAPEKAAALATALEMLSAGFPSRPKSLKIVAAESFVRITAHSTASEVKAAVNAFGDRFKPAAASSVTTATTAQPASRPEPELPPEKQIIRIHGLEDGVREIPLKR